MPWLALESLHLLNDETVRRRLSQLDLLEVWTWGIKGVLSLVILTLLTALTGGALKTFGISACSSITRLKSCCGKSSSIR
jgi:hypothetical protein